MEEEKNRLYQLILRQLLKDGYTRAAQLLSDTALLPLEMRAVASDEPDLEAIVHHHHLTHVPTRTRTAASELLNEVALGATLDLGAPMPPPRARAPAPTPRFSLNHHGAAVTGAFSWEGTVFASGSMEGEIKVVDAQQALREGNGDGLASGPALLLKTFVDHTDAVTSLVFHPRARVLLSGSRDRTIRMFAYASMATRAFETIADSHPVRCLALHPTGDFVLAGCRHPLLRMYATDQPRAAPLVANVPAAQHHTQPINHVSWAADGSLYASASNDGAVKVWDTVTSRPVHAFGNVHGGAPVHTAALSHNSHYLLTSGGDSMVRVLDIRTGATLRTFQGHVERAKRLRASFWGPNDEYVLCGSEEGAAVHIWDVATSSLLLRAPAHTQSVLACIANPVSGLGGAALSFASTSADCTVKFWSE